MGEVIGISVLCWGCIFENVGKVQSNNNKNTFFSPFESCLPYLPTILESISMGRAKGNPTLSFSFRCLPLLLAQIISVFKRKAVLREQFCGSLSVHVTCGNIVLHSECWDDSRGQVRGILKHQEREIYLPCPFETGVKDLEPGHQSEHIRMRNRVPGDLKCPYRTDRAWVLWSLSRELQIDKELGTIEEGEREV